MNSIQSGDVRIAYHHRTCIPCICVCSAAIKTDATPAFRCHPEEAHGKGIGAIDAVAKLATLCEDKLVTLSGKCDSATPLAVSRPPWNRYHWRRQERSSTRRGFLQ